MLPSHLLSTTSQSKKQQHQRDRDPNSRFVPPPPPSLCVTGAMCQQGRCTIVEEDATNDTTSDTGGENSNNSNSNNSNNPVRSEPIVLAYCIFRPRGLHDERKPPLIVIHGGPSIPSNYLLPLVNGIVDRSIVVYDQYGCGRSSRPREKDSTFSIPQAVRHLQYLIHHQLKVSTYHLYGHSFGGILAFEYFKRFQSQSNSHCCSLTLASTPTSVRLMQQEMQRLYTELQSTRSGAADSSKHEHVDSNSRDHGAEEEEEEEEENNGKPNPNQPNRRLRDLFSKTHECRLDHIPLALQDAFAQAGPTHWRGLPAVENYQATLLQSDDDDSPRKIETPPTLLLLGEHDFCTVPCVEGWGELINTTNLQMAVVLGCSHYGMLEDERAYGKIISKFLQRNDP